MGGGSRAASDLNASTKGHTLVQVAYLTKSTPNRGLGLVYIGNWSLPVSNMAEAEARILTDYLIVPASLPGIVTFEQFQSFFPTLTRNSPLLRSLWKDLRSQRDIAIDHVAAAIELEAERGKVMRREVMRQRRDVTAEEIDGEIELERAVSGYTCYKSESFSNSCSSLLETLASKAPSIPWIPFYRSSKALRMRSRQILSVWRKKKRLLQSL